jgi:hypothetical protein
LHISIVLKDRSKSQLKSLSFIFAFDFSAFRLKELTEKQKQTGLRLSPAAFGGRLPWQPSVYLRG